MKKHRGLFWALGLTALIGLSAGEAQAATFTLTVYLNGTSIYSNSVTGTNPQAVPASISTLNNDLLGTGYTFSSLSGQSNNPGTSQIGVGGFVSDNGGVSLAAGGTGGTLMIVVTENGFNLPASAAGDNLLNSGTAIFSGTTGATTETVQSTFSDSATPAYTVNTLPVSFSGSDTNSQSLHNSATVGTYVAPYTLTTTTTISLDVAGGANSSNDVFTGKASLLGVPEPASLIMMVTGMPLPLVVMGLLRRRRAAA